jgi:hypothetical protein
MSRRTRRTYLGLKPLYFTDVDIVSTHTLACAAHEDRRPEVFLVPAAGGRPKTIIKDAAYPTFSRNGQWIYVAAPRESGERCEFARYQPAVVTWCRWPPTGTLAIESYDGDLYYVDATDRPGSLWRLPAGGGPVVKIVSGIVLGSFDVAERGVYYIDRASGDASGSPTDRSGEETRLQYFDFSTQQSTIVAVNLGPVSFGLSVTRDDRKVFYSRIDSSLNELMVVDNSQWDAAVAAASQRNPKCPMMDRRTTRLAAGDRDSGRDC